MKPKPCVAVSFSVQTKLRERSGHGLGQASVETRELHVPSGRRITADAPHSRALGSVSAMKPCGVQDSEGNRIGEIRGEPVCVYPMNRTPHHGTSHTVHGDTVDLNKKDTNLKVERLKTDSKDKESPMIMAWSMDHGTPCLEWNTVSNMS